MDIKAWDKWHKTQKGYIAFGFAELLITYLFMSWTIDNGSLWLYLITFIFAIGSIRNFYKSFSGGSHGRKT